MGRVGVSCLQKVLPLETEGVSKFEGDKFVTIHNKRLSDSGWGTWEVFEVYDGDTDGEGGGEGQQDDNGQSEELLQLDHREVGEPH